MKFNSEITEYLTDKKFSSALNVSFGKEKYPETARTELLVQISMHKNVIHLGFADHLPLIEQKRKNGNWLHGLLTQNCNKCIGIDISPYTLTRIALKAGFKEPELQFADRVRLPLVLTMIKRMKQILGISPYFKANCFNSIVLIVNF